jgi:hypothetical protein
LSDNRRLIATRQAGYYLMTGIWPILHLRSFEGISGPKVDRWLVKTVGALIAVIGAVIGLATWRRRLTPEIELLAIGSAVSLAAIDIVYVARRRIRWVYLLDAAAEVGLVVSWINARRQSPDFGPPPPVCQQPRRRKAACAANAPIHSEPHMPMR